MTRSIVSAWHGTWVVDGAQIVRRADAPIDVAALVERARLRRAGGRTPEDDAMLATRAGESWTTGDRRLVGDGVEFRPVGPGTTPGPGDGDRRRAYLLQAAEEGLQAAWDPSIHVEEAVRAERDLERVANLLGERLVSWVGRDAPAVDVSDPARAAALARSTDPPAPLGPDDPRLVDARRALAALYDAARDAHAGLKAAVAASVPVSTPNLTSLLGPDLAGSMLARAGGLDRLARLPASTVQVLGAERAFFEHLRGRAPPPRHGLLFLHPRIQSAPKSDRGKLARALAGKVAIAARRDLAGSPVAPELKAAFDRREGEIRARRAGAKRSRSPLPLDGAPGDR